MRYPGSGPWKSRMPRSICAVCPACNLLESRKVPYHTIISYSFASPGTQLSALARRSSFQHSIRSECFPVKNKRFYEHMLVRWQGGELPCALTFLQVAPMLGNS